MGAAETKPWKLINLKVKHDVIERIDAAAHAAGLTRTDYIIQRCDPGETRAERLRRMALVPLAPLDSELQAALGHHGPKARDRR